MFDDGGVVFGGTGVAANCFDGVSMRFVEFDDLDDGGEESLCRLIRDHVGVAIAAEAVTEEEETIVMTGGCGRNEALIIDK